MKEAGRQGKHCGRPAKEFDVKKAAELRQTGLSWRKLAGATGVAGASSESAIRRRLSQ